MKYRFPIYVTVDFGDHIQVVGEQNVAILKADVVECLNDGNVNSDLANELRECEPTWRTNYIAFSLLQPPDDEPAAVEPAT